MKRKIILVVLITGMLMIVSVLFAKAPPQAAPSKAPPKASPSKAPPGKVTIKSCQKKKPPVTFDHAKHSKSLKIACKKCHHQGEVMGRCSQAKCHAGKAEGKRPGCEEMSPKKNPYHINCMGCHKKEKKGPTGCGDCHKK